MIGVKTGGAIITSYLASKLKIPYFFIKPENKAFLTKKEDTSQLNKVLVFLNKTNSIDDFKMRETINIDIAEKNVLLVDELCMSGFTFQKCIDYLYKDKKAGKVYPFIFAKNH